MHHCHAIKHKHRARESHTCMAMSNKSNAIECGRNRVDREKNTKQTTKTVNTGTRNQNNIMISYHAPSGEPLAANAICVATTHFELFALFDAQLGAHNFAGLRASHQRHSVVVGQILRCFRFRLADGVD